jgi:hypothetical protein
VPHMARTGLSLVSIIPKAVVSRVPSRTLESEEGVSARMAWLMKQMRRSGFCRSSKLLIRPPEISPGLTPWKELAVPVLPPTMQWKHQCLRESTGPSRSACTSCRGSSRFRG